MKLILPDGSKMELDNELPYEQRVEIVNAILSGWNDYFTRYRNMKTQVCLEVLSNYLCYERKKEGGDDDEKEKNFQS